MWYRDGGDREKGIEEDGRGGGKGGGSGECWRGRKRGEGE